jgi:hypothetical protein
MSKLISKFEPLLSGLGQNAFRTEDHKPLLRIRWIRNKLPPGSGFGSVNSGLLDYAIINNLLPAGDCEGTEPSSEKMGPRRQVK